MKKILLSIVLLFTTIGIPTAKAIDFDWGVTGGLNVTKLNMKGTNENFFGSENRAGWFIGPKIDLGFVLGFGLDASVLYQQAQHNMTLDIMGQELSATHKTDYISLPINARYNIGLGDKFSIFVATGPQLDFAWGDTEENWFKNMTQTFHKENLTVNWNIGAGVRLLKHLEVGLTYNIGLSKSGERLDNSSNLGNLGNTIINGLKGGEDDYRANAFKLHVSYYF